MPLVEIIVRMEKELPPTLIKVLCTNLTKVNQLVDIPSFPTIKGMNLLMLAAYHGKIKLCEELIKNGADVTIVTKRVTGPKLSAISFAGPNMALIEKLFEAGCPYTGNVVDLTKKMLANGALNIADFITNLYDILEKRDFYQKALDLVNKTSTEEKKVILSKITDMVAEKVVTQNTATSESVERVADTESRKWSPQNIDLFLLQYFIAQENDKAAIASQIQELCVASTETSLEVISTLNTQYLDHPDVTTCVHELLADPKKIHQYFLSRKQLIQQQMHELETKVHTLEDWVVGDKTIRESDAIPVESSMIHKIYVWVSDSLKDLVATGMEHLKVLSRDSIGQNGIKFLHGKGIVELKTTALGDKRLVSDGIHVNDKGDMLVCFTKWETHKGIECMGATTTPMTPLDVEE